MREAYREIVSMLSQGNDELIELIDFAVRSPKDFYNEYIELMENIGFESYDDENIPWYVMIMYVLKEGLALEFDWKSEAEEVSEYIDCMMDIRGIEDIGWAWITYECGNTGETLNEINNRIKECSKEKYILCELYIDSDSYVMTVLTQEEADKLHDLAKKVKQRVRVSNFR